MAVARMFIAQLYPLSFVLNNCGISKSSFYYKPIEDYKPKGIAASTHTLSTTGELIPNEDVVEKIKTLLQKEFVDYGYLKVAYYLQDELGYLINHKKVYRLMKHAKLLNKNKAQNKIDKKLWVQNLVPQPDSAFTYWEFDIKFIYIDKAGRYAPLLSVIDVYTRYLIGWMLQWSIKKEDVVGFFDAILSDYKMPAGVHVRNDNGSQFESALVRDFLKSKEITQEFTKPATPEQNAHIESYHSIIQRAICSKIEFENISTANDTFVRWEQFYNEERIHSGIEYKSPVNFMKSKNIVVPKIERSD